MKMNILKYAQTQKWNEKLIESKEFGFKLIGYVF